MFFKSPLTWCQKLTIYVFYFSRNKWMSSHAPDYDSSFIDFTKFHFYSNSTFSSFTIDSCILAFLFLLLLLFKYFYRVNWRVSQVHICPPGSSLSKAKGNVPNRTFIVIVIVQLEFKILSFIIPAILFMRISIDFRVVHFFPVNPVFVLQFLQLSFGCNTQTGKLWEKISF